jgi:tetratricopeptide (TPR) repeat protein
MRSDNTHYDVYLLGATINNAQAVADFIDDAQNVHSNDKYYQCYAGISRANTIISRLALANLKPEANNEILGQAKFIRALLYFDLVRYFGGVSLYKEEVKGITDSYLPRSSKEETYAFILEDVQDAIAKLPEPSFPQTGRATQGSARMLLAYIYMTQKEYAKAEPELKKITAMGYTLLNDYAPCLIRPTKTVRNRSSKPSISKATKVSKAILSTTLFRRSETLNPLPA